MEAACGQIWFLTGILAASWLVDASSSRACRSKSSHQLADAINLLHSSPFMSNCTSPRQTRRSQDPKIRRRRWRPPPRASRVRESKKHRYKHHLIMSCLHLCFFGSPSAGRWPAATDALVTCPAGVGATREFVRVRVEHFSQPGGERRRADHQRRVLCQSIALVKMRLASFPSGPLILRFCAPSTKTWSSKTKIIQPRLAPARQPGT